MAVKVEGATTAGLNPVFWARLLAAVAAVGGTAVNVIDGYRSPADNARVHGAPDSLHLKGDAVDAQIYIPGRGWVPAGTALKGVAAKFGLRSGDQPGFFNGAPDPNHVDTGAPIGNPFANPNDPINVASHAASGVASGIGSALTAGERAFAFVTSWRFAEVLGGFFLLLLGLVLLGRQFGLRTPAPGPLAAAAMVAA